MIDLLGNALPVVRKNDRPEAAALVERTFRAGAGVCVMTATYFETCKQARAELRAIGADFIVFEYGGRWYEITRHRHRPKRICGARKKTGARCRSKSLHRGGKCKFHGGLSTGAKTPTGKAASLAAMRAGWLRWMVEKKRAG